MRSEHSANEALAQYAERQAWSSPSRLHIPRVGVNAERRERKGSYLAVVTFLVAVVGFVGCILYFGV